MKIENGRMIYEPRKCSSCQGVGQRTYHVPCGPHYNRTVANLPGRKCPDCSALNKHSHKMHLDPTLKPCDMCRGEGYPIETAYDFVDSAVFQSFPFRVYRSTRRQTWVEYNLGGGGLYSVTDYGDHKQLSDEELIVKVKAGSSTIQPISGLVSRADHSQVCDHIGIVTNDQGYTVYGVFETLQGAAVAYTPPPFPYNHL